MHVNAASKHVLCDQRRGALELLRRRPRQVKHRYVQVLCRPEHSRFRVFSGEVQNAGFPHRRQHPALRVRSTICRSKLRARQTPYLAPASVEQYSDERRRTGTGQARCGCLSGALLRTSGTVMNLLAHRRSQSAPATSPATSAAKATSQTQSTTIRSRRAGCIERRDSKVWRRKHERVTTDFLSGNANVQTWPSARAGCHIEQVMLQRRSGDAMMSVEPNVSQTESKTALRVPGKNRPQQRRRARREATVRDVWFVGNTKRNRNKEPVHPLTSGRGYSAVSGNTRTPNPR